MSATRRRLPVVLAALLLVIAVAGVTVLLRATAFAPTTITAYFTSATAIYPGDDVRISGVKVGTIAEIGAPGTQVKMTLHVDRGVRIPADAKAIIVAQNLISSRYVQLAPAYHKGAEPMPDGAVIGVDRTAVPVEWDEVKNQLMRLATELGPRAEGDGETAGASPTSVSKLIDSAANAMDGNGDKLRELIRQLSGVGRVLADGSGDVVGIITGLQHLVEVLRQSNTQLVQFQDRLASLTEVLDGSRSDLDEALTKLEGAIDDIRRFVAGTRNQTSEQVQRLANVTQTLVDHRLDLENLLHSAPTAFANGYNIYNPDTGTFVGAFVLQNFANPMHLLCSGIGAVSNATAPETAKLCAEYLGPALDVIDFNYLPFPVNPFLMPSISPDRLRYSTPDLAPGGAGPAEVPDDPLRYSAYTGLDGDVPPPPGWGPPPGPPATLPELLLPAEAPPPDPAAAQVPAP